MTGNEPLSFADLLNIQMINNGLTGPPAFRALEPLAHLPYGRETELKNACFHQFWREHRLPGTPETVIPSPLARRYRTTSRRRAETFRGQLHLRFAEAGGEPSGAGEPDFRESALEPEAHGRIYRFLLDAFQLPAFRRTAGLLNYLIIRGNYSEWTVIFNVHQLDGPAVRQLRTLAGRLPAAEPSVKSAFIYLDPACSSYYLEQKKPLHRLQLKKLFGPDKIRVDFGGYRYAFSPAGFSQINAAMVPRLLGTAGELLAPDPAQRLIDLYCGYGVFALYLAPRYHHVVGVELDPQAIESARDNAVQAGLRRRPEFIASRITRQSLPAILPPPGTRPEALLLDPPRQGTEPGVIGVLAARRPDVVVQACCGTGEIPGQVEEWRGHGWQPERIVPLDMFPGTPNLEVLIAFRPEPRPPGGPLWRERQGSRPPDAGGLAKHGRKTRRREPRG